MKESFEATLDVNGISIELNPFIEKFLSRTVMAAVSSLREAEDMHRLELSLNKEDLNIIVDGNDIALTAFPQQIIIGTVKGLVSSLKGIDVIDILSIKIAPL